MFCDEISELIEMNFSQIFKYSFFQIVKEWFKSNQNWYAPPTMYIDFRSENQLALAGSGKNKKICWLKVANKRIPFFKYSLFQNIKDLFKSNQICCANPTMYVDFKSENGLAVACRNKLLNLVG